MIGDSRLTDFRSSLMAEFSGLKYMLDVSSVFLMKSGDCLMPWASFGPWQSHLGPPGAPSWPEVSIFDDIWGHFGVTLELIWGTGGLFF